MRRSRAMTSPQRTRPAKSTALLASSHSGASRWAVWCVCLCLCLGFGLAPSAWGATYQERAVAAILMGEAWSEGVPGMTAVAEVIHERAVEKGWTPLRVVTSHGRRIHAFSCLNGTTINRLIRKFDRKPDFHKALQIAHEVCATPGQLPNTTRDATHFTLVTEHPYWSKGHRPVAVIGHHAFYRLKHF